MSASYWDFLREKKAVGYNFTVNVGGFNEQLTAVS